MLRAAASAGSYRKFTPTSHSTWWLTFCMFQRSLAYKLCVVCTHLPSFSPSSAPVWWLWFPMHKKYKISLNHHFFSSLASLMEVHGGQVFKISLLVFWMSIVMSSPFSSSFMHLDPHLSVFSSVLITCLLFLCSSLYSSSVILSVLIRNKSIETYLYSTAVPKFFVEEL